MGRKRKKGEWDWLPRRWKHTRNAFYYQVPKGQEDLWDGKKTFKLGTTYPEAHKVWVERTEVTKDTETIGQMLDRFAKEVIPKLAPSTRREYINYLPTLRKVFGDQKKHLIKPRNIYLYYDRHPAKTLAKRQIALLSSAYSWDVKWGGVDKHPFKGEVQLPNNKPRDRYIKDWEWREALNLDPRCERGGIAMIQAYMAVKLLTGLRKSDMLRIRMSDMTEAGIAVKISKTGQSREIEWTPTLRQAVDHAIAVRPVDISPWLFCNKRGRSYVNEEKGTTSGFDTLWRSFMKRLLAETAIEERFTEHDIRARTATKASQQENDRRAQELMAHSSLGMTQSTYIREKVIKPLK